MSHLSNCHHNNAPERVNILGVGISAITPEGAVRQMSAWIEAKDYKYINVCTVHTVMECQRNPNLRDIVNRSGLATPDGMPLVWFCRCHGKKNVTRVYGPDLMLSFCEFSAIKGYRHFFYGGQPGVAQLLVNVLKKNYPRLQVAGAYSPPFRPTGTLEEPEVIKEINDARPDVVWVGLGTPKPGSASTELDATKWTRMAFSPSAGTTQIGLSLLGLQSSFYNAYSPTNNKSTHLLYQVKSCL
jgi:N-acetylglucosaminyldiphosphoundecaprenol N-acetyl-beta-D-mannosaminyltransferase